MRRAAAIAVFICLLAPAAVQAAGDRYVALGDSYTSGPLVPNQHGDPIDCGRSDHNYPSLTAPALSVSTFTDVSCGSAETKDMTGPQTGLPAGGTNPPQFNALRPDTTLVTVGIGGNDAGLVGVAEKCAQLGATQPTGHACRDEYAPGGQDKVAARIDSARPKIAAVLQGIHARSPTARVAIVGYPHVTPPAGQSCYPMVPLSADDLQYIDELIRRINAMIAGQAAVNDAEYVDTYADSGGHDVCKLPPDRWFEGLVPTEPAFPLHPNAKGEASLARSVIKVLSRPRPARLRNGLLVGATRGMRHARPGHAFRVRVRARGARLTRVRVVLRDARGRKVGTSKAFTLGARRRLPAVKVTRRVRAGRYRIVATGRTAAGVPVSGTRRIRIPR
jgi:lysophospholipase L1-like esterase